MIFNYLAQNWIEITAVIFAICYLVLAVKQNILCWICGIISSALYFFIMRSAGLYMEAYLQIFYICMGIYGWSQWRIDASSSAPLVVYTWSKSKHFSAISLILSLSFISALLLELFSDAVLPFLDALVTWGAVVATYMVAKKLLENWIYWFVIDSISILLFLSRELYLTSILFFVYLIIIYFGYRSWTKIKNEMNG